MTQAQNLQRSKPKVIIFDVNETLLDMQPVRSSIAKVLRGDDNLASLWFSTALHHSLVTTVSGDYQDFADIAVAALMMVAQNQAIELSEEQAKQAIVPVMLSLPAHEDVKPSLASLKAQGYKLVCLTNSSTKGLSSQLSHADLSQYFDNAMSIEGIKVYKPDLRAYRFALNELQVGPHEAMMVAAHGWDVAGAQAAGLQTAFIARPGKALYPLAPQPDHLVKDLSELVSALKKTNNYI